MSENAGTTESAEAITPSDPSPRRPWTILGRLSQAVREQNWFAVALELGIVVVGVFLGIQLGNWNTARADARLGQVYTERLLADLRLDRETRQAHAAYYGAVQASAERVVELLAAPDEDLALVLHAYRATEYTGSTQNRATWDEVLSSGKAGLLPGSASQEVGTYFAYDVAADWQHGFKEAPYRQLVRSTVPYALQRSIRERCSDVLDDRAVAIGFRSDCDLDVDPAIVAATARVLQGEPMVLGALRNHLSNLASLRTSICGDIIRIGRAITSLGGDPSEGAVPDGEE